MFLIVLRPTTDPHEQSGYLLSWDPGARTVPIASAFGAPAPSSAGEAVTDLKNASAVRIDWFCLWKKQVPSACPTFGPLIVRLKLTSCVTADWDVSTADMYISLKKHMWFLLKLNQLNIAKYNTNELLKKHILPWKRNIQNDIYRPPRWKNIW
jgi:hypothetical protein